MSIKIVVLDAARLPAGVDFPPLESEKYGWEQYPQLAGEDIAERCWRADILVTLDTPIDRLKLKKMVKIGLLVCAGDACMREGLINLLWHPGARCMQQSPNGWRAG